MLTLWAATQPVIAHAQALDLSPAQRPSLGARSIVLIETAPLSAAAAGLQAAVGETDTDSIAERAALEGTIAWRQLSAALGAASINRDDVGVMALTAARTTRASDRMFDSLASLRDANPRSVRGLLAAMLIEDTHRFVAGARAAEQQLRAGEETTGITSARNAYMHLTRLASYHDRGTTTSPALGSTAPPDTDRLRALLIANREELDADTATATIRLIDLVETLAHMPGRSAEAARYAAILEAALELDGLVRSTRWVGRRQLVHLQQAWRAAVLRTEAASGHDTPDMRTPGAAFARLGVLADTARVIHLVEDVRRERTDTADAGEVLRRLLDGLAVGLTSGHDPAAYRETLRLLELVFGDVRARLQLVDPGDVDRDLRPAWHALDEESREAERRAMTELAAVLAQNPPMVGPAGVSLVATLDERVSDQQRLVQVAELSALMRRSSDDRVAAVGEQLRRFMVRASKASKDKAGGRAAMDDALQSLQLFVDQNERLPGPEQVRRLRAMTDRMFAAAARPGNPRGVRAGTRETLARAIERDRREWLEGWSSPDLSARRDSSAARLTQLGRAVERLHIRATLLHPDASQQLAALAPIELTRDELASLLRSGGPTLSQAITAASRGEYRQAAALLDEAEREDIALDAFVAALRSGPAHTSGRRAISGVITELAGSAVAFRVRPGVDPTEVAATLAVVSRWSAERAAVARSVDQRPLVEIDTHLRREAEHAVELLRPPPR